MLADVALVARGGGVVGNLLSEVLPCEVRGIPLHVLDGLCPEIISLCK